MAYHRFWRKCACGEEFLTIGKKYKCANCLRKEFDKRNGKLEKKTWTQRYCPECGEPIKHNEGDGVARYNKKRTCGHQACKAVYFSRTYGRANFGQFKIREAQTEPSHCINEYDELIVREEI